jgi:hypothetical protein
MKRFLSIAGWTLLVAILSIAGSYYFLGIRKMTKVHELQFPLMLQASEPTGTNYLLPKGTLLYYDQAFPEGFVRYRVYVNVDGVKLESRQLDDPTLISPLTAFPVGKAELIKLLREHPLSKADLSAILKSGQLTKEEIRSVLEEFSR